MSQQDMDLPAEPRVAWDSDGEAWEEIIAENGEPTGVFKARMPGGDGDELTLGQLDQQYGLDSVDAGDRDLLLWLHAEAVWGWRQESARASAEGQAADRYRDDSELALWLYAESQWKRAQLRADLADAVQMVKLCTGHPDTGAPSHFDLIQSVEASRRDWAAEAARLDEENERVKAGNADMLERLIQAERSLAELQEYVSAYHKVLVANHPNGRDLALLAVAQAREATDSGTRYSLEDVEREFAVHPEADR